MEIEKAMVLMEGINIESFPSIEVCIYLLNPQMDKLKEHAMDLIQEVYGH